jgi:hypothetical protein
MERYFSVNGYKSCHAALGVSLHVDASKIGRSIISAMSIDVLLEIAQLHVNEPHLAATINDVKWITATADYHDDMPSAMIALARGVVPIENARSVELMRRLIASGKIGDYTYLFGVVAVDLHFADDAEAVIHAAVKYIADNDPWLVNKNMFCETRQIDPFYGKTIGDKTLIHVLLECEKELRINGKHSKHVLPIFSPITICDRVRKQVVGNASPTPTDILAVQLFATEHHRMLTSRIPLNSGSFWAYRAIWPTVMAEGDMSTKAWFAAYTVFDYICRGVRKMFGDISTFGL